MIKIQSDLSKTLDIYTRICKSVEVPTATTAAGAIGQFASILQKQLSDLNKLREKEKKIQLDTLLGLDISGGGITVHELVKRCVSLRRNVRYNTTVGYNFVLKNLFQDGFDTE